MKHGHHPPAAEAPRGFKAMLDRNPLLVGGVAFVIVLAASAWLARPYLRKPPAATPMPSKAYYYDIKTGDLSEGPIRFLPPLVEGGVTRVRAYVFSCGSCDVASERFVGYVLRLTDAYKKTVEASGSARIAQFELPAPLQITSSQGLGQVGSPKSMVQMEVARPSTPLTWMAMGTKPANELILSTAKACDGKGQLRSCSPK